MMGKKKEITEDLGPYNGARTEILIKNLSKRRINAYFAKDRIHIVLVGQDVGL